VPGEGCAGLETKPFWGAFCVVLDCWTPLDSTATKQTDVFFASCHGRVEKAQEGRLVRRCWNGTMHASEAKHGTV